MKEKRVDFYLALASCFQIMFIGSGGAFVTELIKWDTNNAVMYGAGLLMILFAIPPLLCYIRVYRLTKKSKN